VDRGKQREFPDDHAVVCVINRIST